MDNLVEYKNIKIPQLYLPYDKNIEELKLERECKFVRHIPKSDRVDDTHLISLVHDDNGKQYKELKLITNYKRPVWVTKKLNRNYKDKKEFEHIDRLQLVPTTQSDIDSNVCRALDLQPTEYNLRNLKDSPYLYGYDVPSTAYISYFYKIANNNKITPYKVVNLDLEFDVTGEFNDITIFTISTPGFRHTAVLRRLYKHLNLTDDEIIETIKRKSKELLPSSKALELCKLYDVSVHKNDLELLKYVFDILHIMQPDICTFHNMIYDISRILERLEYYKFNPEDLFSDPRIPKELRRVVFTPAKQFKIKKGIKKSIPMEEQWTTIDITASFMIMDTMTGFDAIRQGQGKLVGGYNLDNILEKNGVLGKLKWEDENTKYMTKLEWHKYMSTKKPFEYAIYGEQDTLSMTDLELKVEDFSQSLPIFAGISDFNRYNSSVHKAICNAYLENRHKGLIVGTTPRNQVDRSYLGTTDWIKTLPSVHIQEIGLEVTNLPGVITNVTAHAEDQDCVSSYPSDIQAANVSVSTLRAEITKVGDYSKPYFKDNNINIISSNSNTLEYCTNMMNMPKATDMLKEARLIYRKRKDNEEVIL